MIALIGNKISKAIITGFLFAFLFKNSFLNESKKISNWEIKLFIFSFVLTELLLFGQGIYLFLGLGQFPCYYQNLFGISIFLPAGLLMLIMNQYQIWSKKT